MAADDPKQQLKRDVEEATGVDDATAERALGTPQRSRFSTVIADNQLLIGVTLLAAIVVGVILSLALNSVWLLVLAVVVHAAATAGVVTLTISLAGSGERPDPRTVARLEEEGVADPERALDNAVDAARRR